MRICFVGSLIPTDVFDSIVHNSKIKPSNAPLNFQKMLIKGLAENEQNVTCISFPNMAVFPNGSKLIWKKKQYKTEEGVSIISPSFLNVIGIKQLVIYLSTFVNVYKLLRRNNELTYVISYSNYPPYARAIRHACKCSANGRAVLLMADLPTYMYTNQKRWNMHDFFVTQMEHMNERDYKKFDAYILLTRYMAEAMQIEDKPSVVVEGFADVKQFSFVEEKYYKPTVMYAGGLSPTYNIHLLIDSFIRCNGDYELWIFGSGSDEEYVKEAAIRDRRIKYFGKVSRNELLHRMKQAHLLVSVKSAGAGHTRYAFPSKILEYMSSATPVLTTIIPGIPESYQEYLIPVKEESVDSLASQLEALLSSSFKDLQPIGDKAFEFVKNEKTTKIQASKIVKFLRSISGV